MLTVTQYGEPLDPSKYTLEGNIFRCIEDSIIINCNTTDMTFYIGDDCSVTSVGGCNFISSSSCVFITWGDCTFDTWSDCVFKVLSDCTLKTSHRCVISCCNNTPQILKEGYFVTKDSNGYIPKEFELLDAIEEIALLRKLH